MGGEYIIDSYLDWYFSDEYEYDEVAKEWVYIGDDDEE